LRCCVRLFIVRSFSSLGFIGVFASLLVSGKPLGFVAILGVLALIGMITKNAVILIDQIESERAQGKRAFDAVVDASSTRFRPIMLTAASTVLGINPNRPTVIWAPTHMSLMGRHLAGQHRALFFFTLRQC